VPVILSHDQIRQVMTCADCARREVDIQTFTTAGEYFATLFPLPDELPFSLLDGAVNVVQVRHDPGCPRLDQWMPGAEKETQVHKVDLERRPPLAGQAARGGGTVMRHR